MQNTSKFHIGVYDSTDNHLTPLQTYLDRFQADQLNGWKSELDSSSLMIEVDGIDYGVRWYTQGCIHLIAEQFEHIYKRLSEGEFSFFKQTLLFCPEDEYLLFEPKGKYVEISNFTSKGFDHMFPIPTQYNGEPNRLEEFYNYIAQNRNKLIYPKTEIYKVPFPTNLLLEALKREAKLGKEIYDLTNTPITYSYY
ncbi:MAG: hypothetical protein GY810_14385 [Aureispira sp.]|nr:hypothetical protein [Aureispira sp.]